MNDKATLFKDIKYSVSSQSKWTFNIPVIKNFVYTELINKNRILNLFAGENPIPQLFCGKHIINNDLYIKNFWTELNIDALELLKMQKNNSFDCIIFDPPYANVKTINKLYGVNFNMQNYNKWIWEIKSEIARVLKLGGKVISVGYETNGIGVLKGFEKQKLLIVAHGGLLRDTFVYTETKVTNGLHYVTWRNRKDKL